jgi:hypothetical protein
MITCDAYDVDVEVDPGVPEDDFATLLKWVHARLAEASDDRSAPVLAPHSAGDPMLLRGRQRVTLLAKRVEAEFGVSGWHVEPLCWATEASAVVAVCGSGGARVEVRFTIGARGKRSTVGIEFHQVDPTGDGGVKAVIEALVEILRDRPAVPASPEEREAIRA